MLLLTPDHHGPRPLSGSTYLPAPRSSRCVSFRTCLTLEQRTAPSHFASREKAHTSKQDDRLSTHHVLLRTQKWRTANQRNPDSAHRPSPASSSSHGLSSHSSSARSKSTYRNPPQPSTAAAQRERPKGGAGSASAVRTRSGSVSLRDFVGGHIRRRRSNSDGVHGGGC